MKSSAGQNISVNLSQNILGPLPAPNMPIRIFNDSKYLGSVMYNISYVTIYIDNNHTNFNHIGYFKNDIYINAKSGIFLTNISSNFNIPSSPTFTSGYD